MTTSCSGRNIGALVKTEEDGTYPIDQVYLRIRNLAQAMECDV